MPRMLPAGPLFEWLDDPSAEPTEFGAGRKAAPNPNSSYEIANRLNGYFPISNKSVSEWRRKGQIPFWTADKVATALNVHIAEIWGWETYQSLCD